MTSKEKIDQMVNKIKTDIVFIVLAYRNDGDVRTFFESLKRTNIGSFQVIVVNSFHDNDSMEKIKTITEKNEGFFLNRENKGYGAGNNVGIAYALEHFDFKLLIVSNPDVEIQKFNNDLKRIEKSAIFAPQIIRNDGRNQNPMRVEYSKEAEKATYTGFVNNNKFLVYSGILLNKADRTFKAKHCSRIYQPHGSFIIFTKAAIEQLNPVFDENIFLFCEESDLAQRCRKDNIPIFYDRKTIIRHHEDGSMKLSDADLNGELKKSFIYYYRKWNGTKRNNLKKIVVRMRGGLGNQLFIFSYALYMREKYGTPETEIILDLREYESYKLRSFELFDSEEQMKKYHVREFRQEDDSLRYRITRPLFHAYSKIDKSDKAFQFNSRSGLYYARRKGHGEVYNSDFSTVYLYGYFQDAIPAEKVKGKIKDQLGIKDEKKEPSIAVSIRCGEDYKNNGWPVYGADYYKKGIQYIKKHKYQDKDVKVSIFADDMVAAKKMDIDDNVVYIEGLSPREQLKEMAKHTDFVLSNSSFAYWGGYWDLSLIAS